MVKVADMENVEQLKSIAQALNTAMVLTLAFGVWMRRRPAIHIPVMLVAFVVDLGNLLLVEFVIARRSNPGGKGAVERVTQELSSGSASTMTLVHISVSLAFLVGYFVAIFTGIRLHRRGAGRGAHRANAILFIVTRLAGYVTSFWM